MKEPGKWFDIQGSGFERNPDAYIIAIEKIRTSTALAFMIRIMVAVMADEKNKIVKNLLS